MLPTIIIWTLRKDSRNVASLVLTSHMDSNQTFVHNPGNCLHRNEVWLVLIFFSSRVLPYKCECCCLWVNCFITSVRTIEINNYGPINTRLILGVSVCKANEHTMDLLWEKFQWILPLYMKPISFQSKASVVCSVTAAIFIDFCLKKLNVFSQHIGQKTNEYLNSAEQIPRNWNVDRLSVLNTSWYIT